MEDPKLSAGEFKATCLRLMDEVARTGREIVVTKRGKPVAKLVPYRPVRASIAGALADSMEIVGDVLAPIPAAWDAVGKWDRLTVQESPASEYATAAPKPSKASARKATRKTR